MSENEIILAACRAHTPQFDRMDAEIKKYAIEAMRGALLASVAELVTAARSVLADGLPDDPEDNNLVRALEPFEAMVPYDDTIEADISAATAGNVVLDDDEDLPYICDACGGVPGYGPDAPCWCFPNPVDENSGAITEGMIASAKAAYWHEVHNGGGYSDKCYEAAIRAAIRQGDEERDG